MDAETAILLRMHQKGLIEGRYRSIQDVRRGVGWTRIASRYREKRKFEAIARKLVKKGLLTDSGKSARVLSLTTMGCVRVEEYLEDNPGALEDLDK